MTAANGRHHWSSEAGVRNELENQPHLFVRLAENALTVAESARHNYFKNTARFIRDLRRSMDSPDPALIPLPIDDATWDAVQGEVVTFIDGGVGQAQISSQMPILLRVGSYSVRTGERRLAERERFGYYPIILGDLEGGSKDPKDFVDIVRITAELLGGLSALEHTPDLRVLMFHGPLVNLMSGYAGHTPFTESDIDLFLRQYAPDPAQAREMKEEFLSEARLDIYPRMVEGRSDEMVRRRFLEPLAWLAYLYRRLVRVVRQRTPMPIVAGVVERSASREFCEQVLLERFFRQLRTDDNADYFRDVYGRRDLTSPEAVLTRLGYTDSLLLAMLLRPGEMSESWIVSKYDGLRPGNASLPGESWSTRMDWGALKPPSSIGFPSVSGCYVHVSPTTEPVRVETFAEFGEPHLEEVARRALLYARLLPGYGFPVGLDIADK